MASYDSDEDEDLKRAIALSLQDENQRQPQEPIDLTGDDEIVDHEIGGKRNAIEDRSQKGDIPGSVNKKMGEATREPSDNKGLSLSIAEAPHAGILALGRKKMEEERLARIRKRKASISPPPSSNRDSHIPKAPRIFSHPSGAVQGTSPGPDVIMSYTQQRTALQATGIQYPKGVVKKTWAYGYPRENDIKIEEVFQKNDLELAVLSSYQWDDNWVLSKLDMSKTKLICVVQTEDEAQRDFMRTNSPPGIRYIFPSMEGQINCMHSKLQLLSHPTHLRVCVPSANLVPYDYGEQGGCMENVIFMIDLPRLPHGSSGSSDDLPAFGKELLYFLKALGMDEHTMTSLLKFDFTQTKDFAFVHSIGGAHSGQAWRRTGYCGLGAAIRRLELSTNDLEIDYVASSIGSLNEKFLATLFLAARGDDGMTEYNWRYEKPQGIPQHIVRKLYSCFRVYFPTRKTVVESKGGAGSGGTICIQSSWWDSQSFPRSIFRDCQSQRPGMLMHNKILFARPRNSANTSKFAAWAYVGSHNLSSSAWGTLVKDRATKMPKMNCRNWECGVVIPIPAPPTGLDVKAGELLGMEVFDGFIPVPMKLPGEEYGSKRPWFFKEE